MALGLLLLLLELHQLYLLGLRECDGVLRDLDGPPVWVMVLRNYIHLLLLLVRDQKLFSKCLILLEPLL